HRLLRQERRSSQHRRRRRRHRRLRRRSCGRHRLARHPVRRRKRKARRPDKGRDKARDCRNAPPLAEGSLASLERRAVSAVLVSERLEEGMAFTAIRTATAEGVTTITLARPDRLNAFTSVMHAELREALDTVERDDAVRCVVLTGEGRAFSAGQDLTED